MRGRCFVDSKHRNGPTPVQLAGHADSEELEREFGQPELISHPYVLTLKSVSCSHPTPRGQRTDAVIAPERGIVWYN